VFHQLVDNGYGKSGVRLVKVTRRGDRHDVQDLTVNVRLDGEFEASYIMGDNTMVLPTDTMKNTVHAFARRYGGGDIEEFAIALTERFLESHEAVARARIDVAEAPWQRIAVGEKPHGQAFARAGDERRTAVVTRTRTEVTVAAGIRQLALLKTGHSAFQDFLRDEYTTLPDATSRVIGTVLQASWRYGRLDVPYGTLWHSVRRHLLETFAQHESLSLQHTLYAMADAVLENQADVVEIQMALPNKHHLLIDLAPFGLDNPNEVFVPTDEPFGLIEATVRRRAFD
jgi:urate oxidase